MMVLEHPRRYKSLAVFTGKIHSFILLSNFSSYCHLQSETKKHSQLFRYTLKGLQSVISDWVDRLDIVVVARI